MRARDARGPRAAAGRRDLRSAREPRGPAQGSCARPARVSPRRGSTAHRAQAGLDRPPSPGGARPPTEPRRGSTAHRGDDRPRRLARSAGLVDARAGAGDGPGGPSARRARRPRARADPPAAADRATGVPRPCRHAARPGQALCAPAPRGRAAHPEIARGHAEGFGPSRRGEGPAAPRPGGRRGGPAHGGAPGRRAMGLRGAARGETARTTAQDPAQDPAAPCPAGRVRRQPHAPAPDRLRVGERDPRGEPARPRPLGRALGAQGPGLSGVVCARS